MAFEKIGPFDLTRGDAIVAALMISFSLGNLLTRLMAASVLLVGLLTIVAGLVTLELQLTIFGVILVLYVFVIAPALRSRKSNKEIYLEYSREGIVAENSNARITYKWATIRAARRVGSRLFVMVDKNRTIVISDRLTTPR